MRPSSIAIRPRFVLALQWLRTTARQRVVTGTLESLLTQHFQRLSPQPFNPQALLVPQQGVTRTSRGDPTAYVVAANGNCRRTAWL